MSAERATTKPTRAERAILDRALRTADGNPWTLISMQARKGGGKSRMFDRMKARGWFDAGNRLTAEGRAKAEGDRS